MAKLNWSNPTSKIFETGIDRCVFYTRNNLGEYTNGVSWNSVIEIIEKPVNVDPIPIYANNLKYLNLTLYSFFNGTIEAHTCPKEFNYISGKKEPLSGVRISQQDYKTFGLAYRTNIAKDIFGKEYSYKLHLVYDAVAYLIESKTQPYRTINNEARADSLSWEIVTSSVGGKRFNRTASLTINSIDVEPTSLTKLENILYGITEPARLPSFEDIIKIFLVGDYGWIVGSSSVGIGRIN